MSSRDLSSEHTLYDKPSSVYGARCRIILYKKGIPANEVKLAVPGKTPQYQEMNPLGHWPALKVEETGLCIPETDTICQYLMFIYDDKGPSFMPNNVHSNLIARLHDMYLAPIQGCMFKPDPPFGKFSARKDAINEFRKILVIIDGYIPESKGPYICGADVSYADATLFPTMVFAKHLLPKFGVPENEALPPKLSKWLGAVLLRDPDFGRIDSEISISLQKLTYIVNSLSKTYNKRGSL